MGAAILLGDINDTKQMLKSMNLALKVGNSDAGSYFNNEVLEDVDYGVRCYLSSPFHNAFCFLLAYQLTYIYYLRLDG